GAASARVLVASSRDGRLSSGSIPSSTTRSGPGSHFASHGSVSDPPVALLLERSRAIPATETVSSPTSDYTQSMQFQSALTVENPALARWRRVATGWRQILLS